MTAAAVTMTTARDDRIPFPSATGYGDGEWGAYRAASLEIAVRWARQLLGLTAFVSESDAQLYAISEATLQVGRRLDPNEELMASYAMRQAWRARPVPLALVPDFDLIERAEAEAADWSDLMREVL